MRSLTVLYDVSCGICSLARGILEQAPAFLPLEFLPFGGTDMSRRFPGLATGPTAELVVVDDAGGVYLDAKAYLMCLYATKAYRALAMRLSTPLLMPLARQAFTQLGRNREVLSRLLRLPSDHELQQALSSRTIPSCNPGQDPPSVAGHQSPPTDAPRPNRV